MEAFIEVTKLVIATCCHFHFISYVGEQQTSCRQNASTFGAALWCTLRGWTISNYFPDNLLSGNHPENNHK